MMPANTIKDRLSLLPLVLVAITIALPIRVNSLATVVSIVLSIALVIIYRKDLKVYKAPFYILILVQGLILVLGLLHTPDQRQGSSDLERYLYAIALPVIVYASRGSLSTARNIVVAFAIGVGALMLYGLIFVTFVLPPELRADVFSTGHESFTEYIRIHPTYLAIYLIFFFFFLAEYARMNFTRLAGWKKASLIALMTADIGAILFVRSQIELLVFVLLLVLYALILYKKRAAMVTFLLFSVGLIVYLSDSTRAKTLVDVYGRNVSSAVDERLSVWGGALEAFKLAPIFGAGTGGGQYKLNEVYIKMGYTSGAEHEFNAHNQYLELLVRNGVVELAAFLVLLYFLFREALRKTEYTFLMMLMLFSMSMIAESCLNVQKGLAFFYFFSAVYIFLIPEEASKNPTGD